MRDATTRLVEKNFHGKPRIFTRQILRGAMHVHACKSEVINEWYCNIRNILKQVEILPPKIIAILLVLHNITMTLV